ncbi:MAG TPA: transposase [Verrucomicrobiota bacterium]|nr:transposase [Verrucomicrobiota bacterium]HNZ76184.1 transposase [Verrucomicrobiota bacterium]HOC51167.1 transposase [Verrucomicrobiota bacterium]HOH40563.1 transposase [Verrucomicrobiota bacterium]HOX62462.1 transposase [Verrucomicrobiota bacterium]
MASKSLSCSSPAIGLPSEGCAAADPYRPSAIPKPSKDVFIVVLSCVLSAVRRAYTNFSPPEQSEKLPPRARARLARPGLAPGCPPAAAGPPPKPPRFQARLRRQPSNAPRESRHSVFKHPTPPGTGRPAGTGQPACQNSARPNRQPESQSTSPAPAVPSRPPSQADYLKEELSLLWEPPSRVAMEDFLRQWCARAMETGIALLRQMAKTLRLHARGILSWWEHRLSSGKMEGVNNKIKTLTRQAYGYRNEAFFILKLLALHHARIKLVG